MNAEDVISEMKRLADRIDNQAAGAEHDSQNVPHRAYAGSAHREDAKAIRELVGGLTQKLASEPGPGEFSVFGETGREDDLSAYIVTREEVERIERSKPDLPGPHKPPRRPMSATGKPTLKECPECEGRIESSGSQYAICENGHLIGLVAPGEVVLNRHQQEAIESELAKCLTMKTITVDLTMWAQYEIISDATLARVRSKAMERLTNLAISLAYDPAVIVKDRIRMGGDLGTEIEFTVTVPEPVAESFRRGLDIDLAKVAIADHDPLLESACLDCGAEVNEILMRMDRYDHTQSKVTLVCKEGCEVTRTWAGIQGKDAPDNRYRHVERVLSENLRCPICRSHVKVNGDYATCLHGHTVNVGELT